MLISDKKEENAMEKNLTTGSVFKNVFCFPFHICFPIFCRHSMEWQICLLLGNMMV